MWDAGAQAAAELLAGGVKLGGSIPDIREEAFANGFLEGLNAGMANPAGWMRDIMDGTSEVAASLNTEPEHGFVELIQNADDVGATVVRFAVSADGREILAVHNGLPVRPVNVLAMTLALVSTKVTDAEATGKFGIGLKTVLRFASSYEVHCRPYSFRVVNQAARQVKPRPAVKNLYSPDKTETLVALRLLGDYDSDGLRDWFNAFAADGLCFMRSVRRIELRGPSGKLLDSKELRVGASTTVRMRVAGKRADVELAELQDAKSGVTWSRLSTTLPAPPTAERSGKKTPPQIPFALAYSDSVTTGRLFAGLPLAVGASLPFHLNAMFDPNASRTDLLAGGWNDWILDRATDFASAAALHRLAHDTARGWAAVPLTSEVAGLSNHWLAERLGKLVAAVQESVRSSGQIQATGGLELLSDCQPECDALESLLSDTEVERLTGSPTIPRSARDDEGRWRLVLRELGFNAQLAVDEALEMCDWDDLDRPGAWFVSLIDVALDERDWAEPQARQRRCLLLSNGGRISPDEAVASGLLLGISTDGPKSLGEYLGLLRPVDVAFLSHAPDATRVRGWLTDEVGLRTEGGDDDALQALANRDEANPIALDKHAVVLLRDALRRTSLQAPELGPAIGLRILVDGFTYERGKRKELPVLPGEAYLPPAIDTGRHAWPAAAHHTPGLKWISPSFKNLLASGGGRGQGERDTPEAATRRRVAAVRERSGAQSFFTDLGAETAPRLVPRKLDKSLYGEWAATVSYSQLHESQRDALGDSPTTYLALQNDHSSPDLVAVLEDIARDKILPARERARALIQSLSRAWRKYAPFERATAVHAYGTMAHLGTVPATWTAKAGDIKWMTNERRQRKAPTELAIRTTAFEAVFGDAPWYYAFGLGLDDIDSGPVRTFGFHAQLRASPVLDRLGELRSDELSGHGADSDAVARCYRALSESAPPPGAKGRRLDDVKVSEVKKLFRTADRSATGLVRTSQGWHRPTEVLFGRPIFKSRANFVAVDAPALWRLLEVRAPTADDCLRVLRDIAAESKPSRDDEAILIDTYRHLVQLLAAEDKPAPRSLRQTPLWTMDGWVMDRNQPVFAVDDQALQLALGERVRVWQPKIRLAEVETLLAAFGVTKLDESSFGAMGINNGALAAGSEVQKTIHAATAHLREWLALNDVALHDKLAQVSGLERARAAVTQKLYVQIRLPDGREEEVKRQAHVDRQGAELTFVFAHADFIEDYDLIGRLLGNLVSADQREEVVLAHGWQTALDKVEHDVQPQGLELAADPSEEPARTTKRRRTKSQVSGKTTDSGEKDAGANSQSQQPPVPVRRLKNLKDIEVKPEWVGGSRPPKKSGRSTRDTPPRQPNLGKSPSTGPGAGVTTWTATDRETLGLQLLERELGRKLKDVRNQDRVGADAIDEKAGTYYELKVHAGDMPDSVRLEPDEFTRARLEKEKFVLVAVSGLEDGFETRLLLFSDPLKRLRWEPNTALIVSGITTPNGA